MIARYLGSIDLLSNGRAAWNVVTTARDFEARNCGRDGPPPKDERYDMADEVLEACDALWNGWGADALLLDKQGRRFADPAKVRYAHDRGKHVSVRGPLSIPRTPQVRPAIRQAGSSPRRRAFAARWGEMLFATPATKADALAYRSDIHARMETIGRDPDECKVLPSITVVVGETDAIARDKAAYLESLVGPELVIALSSWSVVADLSKIDTPEALDAPGSNQGIQGHRDRMMQVAREKGISFAAPGWIGRRSWRSCSSRLSTPWTRLISSGRGRRDVATSRTCRERRPVGRRQMIAHAADDVRRHGAAVAQPCTQGGQFLQPIGPLRAKGLFEPASDRGGQGWRAAASRDAHQQVAATDERRHMHVAQCRHILDIDRDAVRAGGSGQPPRLRIVGAGNKNQARTGDVFIARQRRTQTDAKTFDDGVVGGVGMHGELRQTRRFQQVEALQKGRAAPGQQRRRVRQVNEWQHQAAASPASSARAVACPMRAQKSPKASPSRRFMAQAAKSGSRCPAIWACFTLSASG